MFDMEKAGKKIQSLREGKGLTTEKVAKAIGVSESSYKKYESGIRTPRDEIKERIANFFGKSIAFIFFSY